VSLDAIGYINTAGIHTDEQVEGWKKVTKRVHDKGGKIFIQLWHVGRMSPDFHNGALPLSASAINLTIRHLLQKDLKLLLRQEMTVEDIKTTVKDFQNAAVNAVKAGFDGVEIHSSNGYLFQQFFNGTANHRTDQWRKY
jgi:N-ethylmaleimide reductase